MKRGRWTARDLTLDLSFLAAGSYRAAVMRDGVNADRDGTDYKAETVSVTRDSKLTIHLAPGGGWVAKISPGGSVGMAPGRGSRDPGPADALPGPMIDLNQVGFYPLASKMAVVTGTPPTD